MNYLVANPSASILPRAAKLEVASCSDTDAIEQQKHRALALWDKCVTVISSQTTEMTIPADVDDYVRATLNKGMVPPIFHALVMQQHGTGQPLFPPSTHPLSLGTQPVEAGPVAEAEAEEPDGVNGGRRQRPWPREEDIFKIMLTDQNGTLLADPKPLVDDSVDWEYNADQAASIVALVNANATMMGHDVEVTEQLDSVPFIDATVSTATTTDAATTYNLITRRQSRGVVASCFDSSRPGTRLAITGSTGTGKTWTLLYALQQALLYEQAVVVLLLQKEGLGHVYIRKDHCIFCWTASVKPRAHIPFGHDHEHVLVLLDPKEAMDGGAAFHHIDGMLISAACNHEQQMKDSAYDQSKPERFLSPWTEPELEAALPKMTVDVDVDAALLRARDIGMRPGHVWNRHVFDRYQQRLDDHVDEILEKTEDLQNVLKWHGKDKGFKYHVGQLISVYAALNHGSGKAALNDIAYDGQEGINYTEPTFELANEHVMTRIVAEHCDFIKTWCKYRHRMGSYKYTAGLSVVVEQLFWTLVVDSVTTTQPTFAMERWQGLPCSNTAPMRFDLQSSKPWVKVPERLGVGNLDTIFHSDNKICRLEKGATVAAFAGPGRKVYRVNLSDDFRLEANDLVDLFLQGGYLTMENGTLVPNTNPPPEKLEYIWLVPKGTETTWTTPPRYAERLDPPNEVTQACLDQHVDQFVLPIV